MGLSTANPASASEAIKALAATTRSDKEADLRHAVKDLMRLIDSNVGFRSEVYLDGGKGKGGFVDLMGGGV